MGNRGAPGVEGLLSGKNPEGAQIRDFHRVELLVSHTNNGFLGIEYYKYNESLSVSSKS